MSGRLDRYLQTLHIHGCWIEAWYPLSSREEFECRITGGVTGGGGYGWAVHVDALEALAGAMRKAKLPTESWDEDTEADNPDDLAAAADHPIVANDGRY